MIDIQDAMLACCICFLAGWGLRLAVERSRARRGHKELKAKQWEWRMRVARGDVVWRFLQRYGNRRNGPGGAA